MGGGRPTHVPRFERSRAGAFADKTTEPIEVPVSARSASTKRAQSKEERGHRRLRMDSFCTSTAEAERNPRCKDSPIEKEIEPPPEATTPKNAATEKENNEEEKKEENEGEDRVEAAQEKKDITDQKTEPIEVPVSARSASTKRAQS